jgi:hypothetical protein
VYLFAELNRDHWFRIRRLICIASWTVELRFGGSHCVPMYNVEDLILALSSDRTKVVRVTPLVLLALKLEHDIICIDISFCLSHLECIH